MLNEVYDRRGDIWDLKTNAATYKWFHRADRPSRAIDALELYRLHHHAPLPFQPDFSAFSITHDVSSNVPFTAQEHQPQPANNQLDIPHLDSAYTEASLLLRGCILMAGRIDCIETEIQ